MNFNRDFCCIQKVLRYIIHVIRFVCLESEHGQSYLHYRFARMALTVHGPLMLTCHIVPPFFRNHQPLIIVSHWSSSAIDLRQPLIIVSHWSSSAIDHRQPLIIVSHWSSSAIDHRQLWSHDHSLVANLGHLCYFNIHWFSWRKYAVKKNHRAV
jgi:hypothetical protein